MAALCAEKSTSKVSLSFSRMIRLVNLSIPARENNDTFEIQKKKLCENPGVTGNVTDVAKFQDRKNVVPDYT